MSRSIPLPALIYKAKNLPFFSVLALNTVKTMLKPLINNDLTMINTHDTNLRETQSGTQILCQN